MPKSLCVFTPKLKAKFPCFGKGRDKNEAECIICRPGTFVSVAYKGATDLQNHVQSAKHKKADQGQSFPTVDVSDFFVGPGIKFEDAVSAVEGTLAFHTVMHHSSFRSMDCTSGLLKKLFPDSEVAQKFSSARTKTEAIVNSVLAPQSVESALQALKDYNIPYCGVSTDGSDHGALKIFPVVVQYFDWKNGGLQSKLIEVRNKANETVDTIAQYVKDSLEKNGLFEKCIAFSGDPCNTTFGGLWRDEEGSNDFADLKRLMQKTTLVGVSCPAHILNDCVHHGADTLDLDVENIIFRIYQYFNVYTVRTDSLKEYCDFVDIEFRKLLSHSKTRWLSFTGITRLLQMFPDLKSFFLSQNKAPATLKKFFEDDFSEIYLWHLHSFMSVFQAHIEEIERENNSVVEVLKCLDSVNNILREHQTHNFMSLKVKELLGQNHKQGLAAQCDSFRAQVECQYTTCIDYLAMWMRPLEEFSIFMWIALTGTPNWTDVETTVHYLREKGVFIDDVKCFDQFANLRTFVESMCDDADFKKLMAHQKWTKYFESSENIDCHSELLKIAQFFFAVPSLNANVERVFFLMQSQWTKERSQMSVETLKGILQVQYNYKQMSCKEFHTFLLNSPPLLRKLRSAEKYAWAHHKRLKICTAAKDKC